MDWNTCLTRNEGVPTFECIFILIRNLFDFVIPFSAVVAVFVIIYSGIQFITSGGDKQKIESSRKSLTFAIIGLLVVGAALLVLKIISDLTGINLQQLTEKPAGN